jgi:hypothetical protein
MRKDIHIWIRASYPSLLLTSSPAINFLFLDSVVFQKRTRFVAMPDEIIAWLFLQQHYSTAGMFQIQSMWTYGSADANVPASSVIFFLTSYRSTTDCRRRRHERENAGDGFSCLASSETARSVVFFFCISALVASSVSVVSWSLEEMYVYGARSLNVHKLCAWLMTLETGPCVANTSTGRLQPCCTGFSLVSIVCHPVMNFVNIFGCRQITNRAFRRG